ncbi:FAS1 domain-containing protein [Mycotypha africana]|uniref:FAS1 domain-containing protein n=1 Tax=Mycotypha africana TaxID=64632 RepID=UPI00230074DD|nr:FAS1 domain-containing protein [Mycotypha africana]KAI8968034.1 FAS1 domain-containing protein [Mycotypha africana]
MLKQTLFLLVYAQLVLGANTIIDILKEDNRFETLLAHIQHFQLVSFINDLDSGTLFAPVNDAFAKCEFELDRSTLLYHIIKKKREYNEFYDGQLEESQYVRPGYLGPDTTKAAGQRIKVTTKANNKKVFINQAKIIDKDLQVNNQTYIQVIDQVLSPPALLGDTLFNNNRAIFDLLNSTGKYSFLQQNKPFTLFLSAKENPFEQFNAIESTYLTSSNGKNDLSLFFNYSIVDKAIFLDEFTSGKTTYKSLSDSPLVLAATEKDQSATVNGLPVKKSDIVAANGVIHMIDGTFRPDIIQFNTRKYLYGMNAMHIVELLDEFNLSDPYLTSDTNTTDSGSDKASASVSTNNVYTFLIPPQETLNKSLITESWLKYHIFQQPWPKDALANDMLIETEFRSNQLSGQGQRVPVYTPGTSSRKTIQFDKARVIGDYVNINDNIIYQVSESLTIPGDIIEKVLLELDLSTFIATLYVSELVEEIRKTPGLTLFVPTNEAFHSLDLVAKYLVHPSAKSHLQTVLRHHAVPSSLLYADVMRSKVHEVLTLANSTLRITPPSADATSPIHVGAPEKQQLQRSEGTTGSVIRSDMLVSNGVVHKVSEVLIPQSVQITNQNLLVGIEAETMLKILSQTKLWDTINQENLVVLAPTEKAFAKLNDIDALLANPYELERIARLHLIPSVWQERWVLLNDIGSKGGRRREKIEFPTLLSEDDKVAIRENEKGELFVEVKNGGGNNRGHVLGLGRVTAGGGVLLIDTVLMPIRRGLFGLPFVWSVIVTLVIIILVGGLSSMIAFFGYKVYSRRRLGYRPIY